MKIAIIGAGISGLAAGRELAAAGHHVVIFEEHMDFGGKLVSFNNPAQSKTDLTVPFFEGQSAEFRELLDLLFQNDLIEQWEGTYEQRLNSGDYRILHNTGPFYIAKNGMHSIAKYLSRPLDIRFNEKVGGITHIGEDRIKKRTWMLNFPTSATENFDAVIIATPPRQAYGILNLTADETEALRLISIIDEVKYSSQFILATGYKDAEMPDWNMLQNEDKGVISKIINDSLKSEKNAKSLVFYSSKEFTVKNLNEDKEVVSSRILEEAGKFLGDWASLPEWKHLYFWKYERAENPLSYDYLEFENKKSPLALVGGYLNGNSFESAYKSGLKLGRDWVNKYSD